MKLKLQIEYLFWINIFSRLAGWILIGLYGWGKIADPTIGLIIVLFIMIETQMAKNTLEKNEI